MSWMFEKWILTFESIVLKQAKLPQNKPKSMVLMNFKIKCRDAWPVQHFLEFIKGSTVQYVLWLHWKYQLRIGYQDA